jgi:hypothetical protein
MTPFLAKENSGDFDRSLGLFNAILRYQMTPSSSMDTSAASGNFPTKQMVVLAKYIVQLGIENPSMRDEVFVQLVNQTWRSRCREMADRAWTLLLMAVHAFPPGILTFPMLFR